MATVKSLEERLDEFSEELAEVKASLGAVGTQVATLANNQAAAQVQLAGFATKLDALADKLNATQAQLATLTSSLSTTQAQIAVLTARLDGLNEKLGATVGKLDALLTEHSALKARWEATDQRARETTETVTGLGEFRAKAETTFALMRWVGAFAAASMLTVFGAAFAVVRSTMSVEAKLEQQQKSLDEIKRDVNELKAKQK